MKLDASTREQLYTAVMQSQDPVNEVLLPLIDVLAKQILVADGTDLNEKIRADFKKYDDVRKLFTGTQFHDVMLRAIASACLANLMDLQAQKTALLMPGTLIKDSLEARISNPALDQKLEADQIKARKLNMPFANKITIPFDTYISTLTAARFAEDLARHAPVTSPALQAGEQLDSHWFVAMVVRALQIIVDFFSGQRNRYQHTEGSEEAAVNIEEMVGVDSKIEQRVRGLSIVVDKVVATITPFCDAIESSELLQNIKTFADNLYGLTVEIDDSREMGMDFEARVKLGFEKLCEGFSDRLGTHIQAQSQVDGSAEHAEVLRIVNELTESLAPLRVETPDIDTDDSSDDDSSPRFGSKR